MENGRWKMEKEEREAKMENRKREREKMERASG
jgi:hypothetical protein